MRILQTLLALLIGLQIPAWAADKPIPHPEKILDAPRNWERWPEVLKELWAADRGAFVERLGGKHPQHSALAADVLEAAGEEGARWALEEGLAHPKARVRAQAAALLGRRRIRGVSGRVATLLGDVDEDVREMAARALSRIGTDVEVPSLTQAAQSDKCRKVRRASALSLAWLATRAAGEALVEKIPFDKDGDKREALKVMTGEEFLKDKDARSWWEDHRPASGYGMEEKGMEEAFTTWRRTEPVRYPGKGRERRRCERSRVLFLFDVSGSIPNPKGLQKSVYGARLRELPEDVYFDAIAFSGGVSPWKGFLVTAEERANRRDASDWITRFDGMSLTTPLSEAIRRALTDYDADEVVIFTDGGGNTGVVGGDLFDYIQAYNVCRRVRLRLIPVGNAVALREGRLAEYRTKLPLDRLEQESGGLSAPSALEFIQKTLRRD